MKKIAEIICQQTDLEKAVEELVGAANEAGGIDNITVLLFRCDI